MLCIEDFLKYLFRKYPDEFSYLVESGVAVVLAGVVVWVAAGAGKLIS